MRIGIFGATGQIGHALAIHLLEAGKGEFTIKAVKRRLSPISFPPGVEVVSVEDFSPDSLDSVLGSIDHAIYAVGCPEKWVSNSSFFEAVNVGLLKTFLERLRGYPGLSLTYFSTFEVFADDHGVIRESGRLVKKGATPYYDSMVKAYKMVREFEAVSNSKVIFIHPAAVYGGLNTGLGLTDYLINLNHGRFWKVPFVPPGSFPLVHVESLAEAVRLAILQGRFGESFLVSDAHLSLHELGMVSRAAGHAAFVPSELPLPAINFSVAIMESVSRLTGTPPLTSKVQVKYITQGLSMECEKARSSLGWKEMSLKTGLGRLFPRPDQLTAPRSAS